MGIGTTSPDTLAHLAAGAGSAVLRLENTDAFLSDGEVVGKIEFETQDAGGAGVNAYIQGAGVSTEGATRLEFGTGGSGSPSTRMTINSNGNVGIGTISPADLLDISANGTSAMRLSDSSSPATYAQITQANGVLTFAADAGNAQTGSNMQFEVDGAEAMRIDASGNVGIGTSSVTNPNSYGRVLNVAGYAPAIVLSEDTGRDYTIGVNGNKFSIFDETDAVLTIDDSGNVGIGTSSPASSLDIRSLIQQFRAGATCTSPPPAQQQSTKAHRYLWVVHILALAKRSLGQ